LDIKDSRILCIGGAGFIGSHLVDLLTHTDAAEIIVYDNFCRGKTTNLSEALRDSRVRVFDIGGDIRDIDILNDAMKGVDYVFHLAALWLLQCHEYPRAAFETNIAGTFNVIEACVRNKVKKLVYSSSASVYGNAISLPMTEEHPFNNRTFYGATKIACEQMCRAFCERYGLDYTGLRYMNVYGPRQDYKGAYVAVIMKVLDQIRNEERPTIYGDGKQTYDFVYVKDVARANLCALLSGKTGEFYNVGMGEPTTITELVEAILALTGSKLEPMYAQQGQTFVTSRVGSTGKAARDMGFIARTTLEQGLQELIKWRSEI
jgi:UDP-glucose 4-epimerase